LKLLEGEAEILAKEADTENKGHIEYEKYEDLMTRLLAGKKRKGKQTDNIQKMLEFHREIGKKRHEEY